MKIISNFATKYLFMKRLLLLLFLILITFAVKSQGVSHYIELGKAFIDKPENIDSTRLYQLPARFCFALTSRAQQVGYITYSNFMFLEYFPSESLSYLGERICKKVGFEVGYGSVSFGYDVEVGQKSAKYKRSLSLGMSNLKWGIRLSYMGLQNYIISEISIKTPDDEIIMDTLNQSDGLGKLRNFTADGYYVFNSKRFGYTATNTINVVQKHTSGSFMLGGRFMWSSLETKEDMVGLFESYSTVQLALGGGYSANIVLWNRNISNNDDRTIRNITWNITAMPVISLVNYMQTRAYLVELNEDNSETETSKESDVWCYPSPNLIGSTALSFTWGRFYFTSVFQLNLFYFSSTGAVNKGKFDAPNIIIPGYDGKILSNVTISGVLYNYSLSAKLFYRF